MAAIVVDPSVFRSGREFAASLGLVPRQVGTGGKVKLGSISKRGNGYLRRLLVNGTTISTAGNVKKTPPRLSAAFHKARRHSMDQKRAAVPPDFPASLAQDLWRR
jgi:transposase